MDVTIEEIRQKHAYDDMLAIPKMNVLEIKSPLEKQASRILILFRSLEMSTLDQINTPLSIGVATILF